MTTPLLTIGMAHFDDFSGLYPTIQSIRLNNADLLPQCEFVVVDNSAEDKATGQAIADLLSSTVECYPATYVGMPGNKGTSLSREAIFANATGKYVLVMDCHLELWPGSLAALIDHYVTDPDSMDIISGPMLMDTLRNVATHFDDEWRGGMWGTWGQAWQCRCQRSNLAPRDSASAASERRSIIDPATSFAIVQRDSKSIAQTLTLAPTRVKSCGGCNRSIPTVDWHGHEQRLIDAGFEPLGLSDTGPFEIPGMGLGLFSCRREVWPGFNKNAIGFGGEELYIQEKFRRNGGKALCLPALKWAHRFYRKGGSNYPNSNWWKARNYVLEFQELGWDVEPIRKHFVEDVADNNDKDKKKFLTPEHWEALIVDPINNVNDNVAERAMIAAAVKSLPFLSIEELYDTVQPIARDLNEHMPALRALATVAAGTVVEFTGRRESTIAFLAGRPKSVISFNTETEAYCHKAASLVADTTEYNPRAYQMGAIAADLPDNDLLFVDTFHRYGQLMSELIQYVPHCHRFIVLHDTEIYGDRGDDNGLGLRHAIAEFCATNSAWAVIDHTKEQYGLTVLSCLPTDRPVNPVTGFIAPAGPGTELKKILTKLGITPSPTCGCNSKAMQMDLWGIEGCETEHFETIVGWLKEGTWSNLDLASAVAHSVFSGLAWQINPLNPFESLVKLCIKRAKEAVKP